MMIHCNISVTDVFGILKSYQRIRKKVRVVTHIFIVTIYLIVFIFFKIIYV